MCASMLLLTYRVYSQYAFGGGGRRRLMEALADDVRPASDRNTKWRGKGRRRKRGLVQSRCRASFFIIGARKGGTTSLYQWLSATPNIAGVRLDAGAQAGELFFFPRRTKKARARARNQSAPGADGPATDAPLLAKHEWRHFYAKRARRDYDALYDRELRRQAYCHTASGEKLLEARRKRWCPPGGIGANSTHAKSLAALSNPSLLTGESSVSYYTDANTPAALRYTCAGRMGGPAQQRRPSRPLKIIFLARDPVARMVSQFRQRVRLGTDGYTNATDINGVFRSHIDRFRARRAALGFGSDADLLADRNASSLLFANAAENSVWASLYVLHLRRWRAVFPHPGQLLVIKSERMFAHGAQVLRRVLRFLNQKKLPPQSELQAIARKVYNQGTRRNKKGLAKAARPWQRLQPALRAELRTLFAPYNSALLEEEFFGKGDQRVVGW